MLPIGSVGMDIYRVEAQSLMRTLIDSLLSGTVQIVIFNFIPANKICSKSDSMRSNSVQLLCQRFTGNMNHDNRFNLQEKEVYSPQQISDGKTILQ
jgi:hypothetical protein